MRLVYIMACLIAGIFSAALLAVILSDEPREELKGEYDEDSDGGFFDDWRLP